MVADRIYTVGHGNRILDEFVELLRHGGIAVLMDVRAYPRSRRHPQFNDDVLREVVQRAGIEYHWAGRQLGGMRTPRPDSPHVALARTLRGYAEYMDTPAFGRSVDQLVRLGARAPLAILCAERLPEHCHRSLIADRLTVLGVKVIHLIEKDRSYVHTLRSTARIIGQGLVYDRLTQVVLDI